jgi:hypothetical protein
MNNRSSITLSNPQVPKDDTNKIVCMVRYPPNFHQKHTCKKTTLVRFNKTDGIAACQQTVNVQCYQNQIPGPPLGFNDYLKIKGKLGDTILPINTDYDLKQFFNY